LVIQQDETEKERKLKNEQNFKDSIHKIMGDLEDGLKESEKKNIAKLEKFMKETNEELQEIAR